MTDRMTTRAFGTDTSPEFDLLGRSRPMEVKVLALLAAAQCDPIERQAVALHDLTNVLIDRKGELRADTEILDANNNFHPQWQDQVSEIKKLLLDQVRSDTIKSLDQLSKADVTRIIASLLIANKAEGFAEAVISQDLIDKQRSTLKSLTQNGATTEVGMFGPVPSELEQRRDAIRRLVAADQKEAASATINPYARPDPFLNGPVPTTQERSELVGRIHDQSPTPTRNT